MRQFFLHRERGATRLELAIAAILTALLAAVLLNRLISYQGETEQVAAKQLVGSLRTALAVQSARVISTTGEAGLMALSHQNPMTWLQRTPENYLGEYYSPKKSDLPTGNWYFDRTARTLVYLTSSEKSFSFGTQKVMSFKVKLLRVSGPVNASGQLKGTTGLVIDQISDQAVAVNDIAGFGPRSPLSEKK